MSFNIKPLSGSDEIDKFFFAREDELAFLMNQICDSNGGKAFAISGRRGSGKSTLMNKLITSLDKRDEKYLIVKVEVPKEFDEILLLKRLLRKVCESVVSLLPQKDPLLLEIIQKLIKLDFQTRYAQQIGDKNTLQTAIKARLTAIFTGLDVAASVEKSTTTEIIDEICSREYDVESIQHDLHDLLEKLADKFDGIVIIVDETDKSDYIGAIRTLDNIKSLFWVEKCFYLFIGSEDFYEDYTTGIKTGRKTLLDSLFTRIIYLQPFDNDQIEKLLLKRFETDISDDAKKIIRTVSILSKGSPRDAVRYCDLLIGERKNISNASLSDLGNIIKDSYPNFPRNNIRYFIPFSIYISEVSPRHIDPIVESCAIYMVATVMEMDPNPEEIGGTNVFMCDKTILEHAIVGEPTRGKFTQTQYDIALSFLKEIGVIYEENNYIKLEDNTPKEHKAPFEDLI